jgi:predicted phage tail protein
MLVIILFATADNADSSLSSRIDTVQATANGLTASVQTQSQAISTIQNGAQAMWTTKTQVGDITAGIGLMTDSNGKSQVMISASQLFMFDPNGSAPTRSIFAVSNGQVVIQKAVIEAATIETVTAMSITADYVRAGVSLTSPNLVGGTLSIGSGDNSCFMEGGSIGIGKGGPYGGWGYGWHTIIYNDGGIYTDRIYASGGTFNNVTINENCDVRGTIYADKIVGDVVSIKSFPTKTIRSNSSDTGIEVYSITIAASPLVRTMTITDGHLAISGYFSNYNVLVSLNETVISGNRNDEAPLEFNGTRTL